MLLPITPLLVLVAPPATVTATKHKTGQSHIDLIHRQLYRGSFMTQRVYVAANLRH